MQITNNYSFDEPIIANSIAETTDCGYKLASLLKMGQSLHLSGDLGSGKTTLCKGILNYFGYKKAVLSPTFAIVKEYRLPRGIDIFHFDLYRLKHTIELEDIGFRDYFQITLSY